MAITIGKSSMVFLPTEDASVMEVTLDYTKDDLTTTSAWNATWKSITFLWNKNVPAELFIQSVQAELDKQRSESTAQRAVKTAVIAVTTQCKAVDRIDPAFVPPPIPGSDADHPVYVRVVV